MSITPLPVPPSRSNPTDFSAKADAFLGALPTFVEECNDVAAAMNLNDTTSTSTTSLTIGTGAQPLTVDLSKSFQVGMSVKIAHDSTNWMHGEVTSYNSGTGALVVNVMVFVGSGTETSWTVTLSGPCLSFASSAEAIVGTEEGKTISPKTLKDKLGDVVGIVLPFAKSTAPDGWITCNGSAYSRTTYANLFAVIGTSFGSGDGSTTFNVPDLRNRVAVGFGYSYAFAATGGEAIHALTVAEMPYHRHTESGWAQVPGYGGSGTGNTYGEYTGYEGGSQAHNNMQPFVALNYIIKY